jgi:hypothetical protein
MANRRGEDVQHFHDRVAKSVVDLVLKGRHARSARIAEATAKTPLA